jgi:hypothetical protein
VRQREFVTCLRRSETAVLAQSAALDLLLQSPHLLGQRAQEKH